MSSSAATSTSVFGRLAFWRSQSTVQVSDVEAQREFSVVLPSMPTLAHTTSTVSPVSPAKDEEEPTNAIDDFFGVTYSNEERRAHRLAASPSTSSLSATPTRASRHDDAIAIPAVASTEEAEDTTDAIDDFFGVTRPRSERAAASNRMSNPPPYMPSPARDAADTETGSLPSYDEVSSKYEIVSQEQEQEPYTVPEFLFRWGFRKFVLASSTLYHNAYS